MAYRPHGRATVNANSPSAFAVCDRCKFTYNHKDLRWQYDYRGPRLTNLRILVCETCYDTPQPQLKPLILSADPMPIINARPLDYDSANVDNIAAPLGSVVDSIGLTELLVTDLITESGANITGQPVGPPLGLDPNAIMPLIGTVKFDVYIPVLSISTLGSTTVTVTCKGQHNLVDNSQVAITGTSNNKLMGFYSVKVVSATVFTYEILPYISAGNYTTDSTTVATCSIGLPPNYTQVPIIGIATGVAGTPYQWVNNSGQPVYWENNNGQIVTWSFSQ